MKIALLEIAPELAAEAFAVLRDAGAVVLGSQDAAPNLRIVVSHDGLPPECEPKAGRPTPVALMDVRADDTAKLRLAGFRLNPYAAQPKPRRR